MNTRPEVKEKTGVRGFLRVHLVDDPDTKKEKIVGDSGWNENQVVNLGFNAYLCLNLAGTTGSKQVTHMALGTGTEPGAAATALDQEVEKRQAISAASSSSSKTIRFTATFASGDAFVTKTEPLSNIGLFNTSAGGTIFAGNTYASSNCATNQNVNATYDIIFT